MFSEFVGVLVGAGGIRRIPEEVYETFDDIGDIRVSYEGNDKISSYIVSVTHGEKVLERLEYPGNRLAAQNEYNMLRLLLRKVAAIHKLI